MSNIQNTPRSTRPGESPADPGNGPLEGLSAGLSCARPQVPAMAVERDSLERSGPMTTLPKLSVIIPAFNEASRLPPYLRQVIEYLRARNEPFEIIVVNDGSIDRTAAVVEECQLSTPELRLINLRADPETNGGRTNQGKGNAVRLGVQEARGELVLFADADGSTPIAEVERLEASLAAGTVVASASRAVQST